MKILHLMATGNNGGIESLVTDYAARSKNNNVFIFAWDCGICGEELRKKGHIVYDIKSSKGLMKVFEIWKICKIEKPDYVIVHHSSPLLRLAALYLKKYQVILYQHYVYTSSNYRLINSKEALVHRINKLCFKNADYVLAISKAVKKSLIVGCNVNADKIKVIYNGVDLDRFNMPIHVFDGTVHICFVGRITEGKGIHHTLKALEGLPGNIQWDFSVYGDGPYLDVLREMQSSSNVRNNVEFYGNCNNVPAALKNADVFVHSCIEDEGFGISVVEAMAAGKICIVSNSGGLLEIVDDEVNGMLFEQGNINDLRRVIQKVLSNINHWEYLEKQARTKAKQFSIENYTMEMDGYLERIRK